MPQADNIVSFPVPKGSTDFLHAAIGSPVHKLGAVAERLEGLSALVSMAKRHDEVPPFVATALFGIELALDDCLSIISLEPVK